MRNRVLMLLENNPYPQDVRVRREAQALTAAGYHVSVVCPAGSGQKWHELSDRVQVYRFPAPPPANGIWGYLWEYGYSMVATFFITLLVYVSGGFDVIHAANPPDTYFAVAAFYKLLGKRFVFDHHDLSPEMYRARFGGAGNKLVYRILVWLEKLSYRLADRVIVTNQSYKTIALQRGGLPEERVTIVRNGPDLDKLGVMLCDEEHVPGKHLIAYAGVMGVQDGVDYLLRALRCLRYDLQRTDFLCVLVGAGDALPSLEVLTYELDLTDYVSFTGWLNSEEVPRHLAAADICVAPEPSNSYTDRSTMIKMMEYMAAGKPIVAFDLPEHRFSAGEAAVYVPPNDELEFARAIAQLMDDPVRRCNMGRCGRRRVETEFAWQHSVPHLLAVYRSVLAQR